MLIKPSSTKLQSAAQVLREFCENEVHSLDFCIIFGSSALEVENTDIDFKIFTRDEISDELREKAGKVAQQIQKDFGVDDKLMNEDVPYEIKTISNREILSGAIQLMGFREENGRLVIPEINFEPKFLSSITCQHRTILNALTTPNIFITGNKESYFNVTKQAFRAIHRLILSVYNLTENTPLDVIINLLTHSPKGNHYKAYLGYKDHPIIRQKLYKNLRNLMDG